MVTETPDWLKPFKRGTGSLIFAGEVYVYAIVDPEFADRQEAPRIFTIWKKGVLAVSDEYPEDKRNLGLIHELIEKSLPQNDFCCLTALKEELELARDKGFDMSEYIAFRTKFFDQLVTFYKNQDEFEGRGDLITRMTHSLEHLRGLSNVET